MNLTFKKILHDRDGRRVHRMYQCKEISVLKVNIYYNSRWEDKVRLIATFEDKIIIDTFSDSLFTLVRTLILKALFNPPKQWLEYK